MARILIDTDVLIEISRGNKKVVDKIQFLHSQFVFCVSVITATEFLCGAKDKAEFDRIKKYLKNFIIIEINENISKRFFTFILDYHLSHRSATKIADMLIAATTIYYEMPLFTLNKKDYLFIEGINLIS